MKRLEEIDKTNLKDLKEFWDVNYVPRLPPFLDYKVLSNDTFARAIAEGNTSVALEGIKQKKKYFKHGKTKTKLGVPWFLIAVYHGRLMDIIPAFVAAGIDINETYQGYNAIQIAINECHVGVIHYLLDNKASLRTLPAKGYDKSAYPITYLLLRCLPKEVALLKRLIEHGLDVNEANCFNETGLMFASSRHNLDMVNAFLEYPNINVNLAGNWGNTALSMVLEYEGPVADLKKRTIIVSLIVDKLLKKGAIADTQSIARFEFKFLIKSRPAKKVIFLMTPLVYAAYRGYDTVVLRLVKEDVDVNTWFGLPLFMAARSNKATTIKILLTSGANIDAYVPELGTALMGAAFDYHYESIGVLLDNNADIYAIVPNTRETLLSFVLKETDLKLKKIFLKEKIKREIADVLGKMALESPETATKLDLLSDQLLSFNPQFKQDGSLQISFNMRYLIDIIPGELSEGLKNLTLSTERQAFIHLGIINGSIKTDPQNFENSLYLLYWEHSNEKMLLEENKKRRILINLKKDVLAVQENVLEMPRVILDLLIKQDNLLTELELNYEELLTDVKKLDPKFEKKLKEIGDVEQLKSKAETLKKAFDELYAVHCPEILRLAALAQECKQPVEIAAYLKKIEVLQNDLNKLKIQYENFKIELEKNKNNLLDLKKEMAEHIAEIEKAEQAKMKQLATLQKQQQKVAEIAQEIQKKKQDKMNEQNALKEANRQKVKEFSERQAARYALIKRQTELEFLQDDLGKAPKATGDAGNAPKKTAIVVQFKGNIEREIENSGIPKRPEKEIDVDIQTQVNFLKNALNFLGSLPDQTLLVPQELHIVRYAIMYFTAITGESLHQLGKGKESVFSNSLRNMLFSKSSVLFPDIDYRDVDAYIETNKKLILMVKNMIAFTLDTTGKVVLNSELYLKIKQLEQAEKDKKERAEGNGEDPESLIHRIARDAHVLFALTTYKKAEGYFSKNFQVIEAAKRFIIGRLGKNATLLEIADPDLYQRLNIREKRLPTQMLSLDYFRERGNYYRHIRSLETFLARAQPQVQVALTTGTVVFPAVTEMAAGAVTEPLPPAVMSAQEEAKAKPLTREEFDHLVEEGRKKEQLKKGVSNHQ